MLPPTRAIYSASIRSRAALRGMVRPLIHILQVTRETSSLRASSACVSPDALRIAFSRADASSEVVVEGEVVFVDIGDLKGCFPMLDISTVYKLYKDIKSL